MIAAVRLPAVMGHRGAAALAPENTLAGFRAAARAGARWVELDVRRTADGHCVLSHDKSLERTTGCDILIEQAALADLSSLDAGASFSPQFAGEPVPTLGAALETLAALGLAVNIEVKPCPGREETTVGGVADALDAFWPDGAPPALLSSFDTGVLAAAKGRLPRLPRALIARRLSRRWRSLATGLACLSLHCREDGLTPRLITAIKKAGLQVAAYTINDPRRALALWGQGADCVITDVPDRLLAARRGGGADSSFGDSLHI